MRLTGSSAMRVSAASTTLWIVGTEACDCQPAKRAPSYSSPTANLPIVLKRALER